ncbi:MAG TPA: toll/interleukin-1 receptor domain-containing protein [Vicinamibacterales bacterium]|nr:toll/interleukin-1 receptor domain-containing protein [Vicinamibacterales bacterium]
MPHGKIFINYRRDDSRADSGRLYDRLVSRFPGKVFRDVASLEPGVEWHEAITRVLGQADACIVVIGKEWLTIADASGRRRLDNPRDTVRQELVVALERKMRVFPVLVGGARMPDEQDLPADIQSLSRRNALEITEQDWDEDFDKLVRALETSLALPSKRPDGGRRVSRAWMAVAAATLALLVALGGYAVSRSLSMPNTPGPEANTGGIGPTIVPAFNRPDERSQLVGTWKANVVELGLRIEIIWHVWPDGTSSYLATSATGTATVNTMWTYTDGVIYERSSSGPPSSGSIKWIDHDHFVLTIIDNGDPRTRGLERHYSRL